MTKLVFLDTETTGLDSEQHEVWEVGYILRLPGEEEDRYRLFRIYPDLSKASPDALRFLNFYERISAMRDPASDMYAIGDRAYNLVDTFTGEPADKPLGGFIWSSPKAVAGAVARDLLGAHVVGAVPWFDAALNGSFISKLLVTNGQRLACHYHLVDVEAMAVGYLAARQDLQKAWLVKATPPWNSDEVSQAVGVDPELFDRHTALGDARWARAIYDRITS